VFNIKAGFAQNSTVVNLTMCRNTIEKITLKTLVTKLRKEIARKIKLKKFKSAYQLKKYKNQNSSVIAIICHIL
jgi:hypothetical protein